MRTLASAARLLDGFTSLDSSAGLLTELGFGKAVPLIETQLAAFAFPSSSGHPLISKGCGALRALVLSLSSESVRDDLTRIAHRLNACAAEFQWLLLATTANGRIAIAAVDASESRPRARAVLAEHDNVVDSDAETVCALAAAVNDSDALTYSRWLEILGRDSVGRRFFRSLDSIVRRMADGIKSRSGDEDASKVALLYVSRLIFLSFLETKGWLDGDHGFLVNQFSDCMLKGGGYHERVLRPLFFGTLNTHPAKRSARAIAFGRIPFLNGGLFARARMEARLSDFTFDDEILGDLFGELLSRYRFTAREDTSAWSEASIDPEMLGKAFESLMSARDRKTSGAFYTPHSLVTDVSSRTLSYALASQNVDPGEVTKAIGGTIPSPSKRAAILDSLSHIQVLDPACGSGAFLVDVLETASSLRAMLGDLRSPHAIRREFLTRSIFGVDINPMAVWLCELRLWLSMAIDDPETDPLKVKALPNLDRNIRVGDALSGEPFRASHARLAGRGMSALRLRYSRASGVRKKSLARLLDAKERGVAIAHVSRAYTSLKYERSELLAVMRARDLFGNRQRLSNANKSRLLDLKVQLLEATREIRRLRSGGALPFSFPTRFSEVAARGGFDVVIGNPPWVRIHNLPANLKEQFSRSFITYQAAAWMGGSDSSAAGRGFGSQADMAAMFIERAVDLLRPGGTSGLIVPAKLWRALAGGGLRTLISDRTHVKELHDLTGSKDIFDAAVYPSVLIVERAIEHVASSNPDTLPTRCAVHRSSGTHRWSQPQASLSFDDSPGSPWILLPSRARNAFDILTRSGPRLAQTPVGRPLLGVKTGCNDAFILDAGGAMDRVESFLLRPLLRGHSVTKWKVSPSDSHIIWTHDENDIPLASLPPRASSWFNQWQRQLVARTDAKRSSRWWSLFRTESADPSHVRVVWSDIGRVVRAAVLMDGDTTVPLNSCYVARCPELTDAFTLVAILNSTLASAWLSPIAEPARGGYHRYLGWTMSLFPLPSDWERATRILSPIGERAVGGCEPEEDDLESAVIDAYGVRLSAVAPLIEWSRKN